MSSNRSDWPSLATQIDEATRAHGIARRAADEFSGNRTDDWTHRYQVAARACAASDELHRLTRLQDEIRRDRQRTSDRLSASKRRLDEPYATRDCHGWSRARAQRTTRRAIPR